MELAKPHFDVGWFTDRKEESLAFWADEVGLAYEELLPTGGGNHQHRFAMNGAVLKMNLGREALPPLPDAGFRELTIDRPGLLAPKDLSAPGGHPLRLAPQRVGGVPSVAMRIAVRDLDAARRFYGEGLGLPTEGGDVFRCGHARLCLEEDAEAAVDPPLRGPGYRYLTIQTTDCMAAHRAVLARGGQEGAAPRKMGEVAIFSMVRDPEGNWIELSQRASLTGTLPDL